MRVETGTDSERPGARRRALASGLEGRSPFSSYIQGPRPLHCAGPVTWPHRGALNAYSRALSLLAAAGGEAGAPAGLGAAGVVAAEAVPLRANRAAVSRWPGALCVHCFSLACPAHPPLRPLLPAAPPLHAIPCHGPSRHARLLLPPSLRASTPRAVRSALRWATRVAVRRTARRRWCFWRSGGAGGAVEACERAWD
jgi:hypothetical protein